MEIKIKPQIFKAYDIRGIYPTFLDEKTAYFIGKAFVKFLKKKNPKIVIGKDNRLSSPSLFKALKIKVAKVPFPLVPEIPMIFPLKFSKKI